MLPTLSRLVPPTGGSRDGNANNSALGEILVNPDLVAILVNNAARANEESDRYTAVDEVLQIAKTTPAQMAAVYLVAFKQWGEQDPNRPSDAGDDKYHAVVIYTWILRKAVARQQWAPNRDWAAMFDTLLENRYSIRTDDQRAAAYTVALQWCGVPLPERTTTETSEDGYNLSVIEKWKGLRAQRDDPVRNASTMTTMSIFNFQGLISDKEKTQLINLIQDPHTNLYMENAQDENIVSVLVQRTNTHVTYDNNTESSTGVMLDCWVTLVGRADYDPSLLFNYYSMGKPMMRRSLLTYVIGTMQNMIVFYLKNRQGFDGVWDKYMIVVKRSVETAGTALNKIYGAGTLLTIAIEKCSGFGSESWRHVTNTKMVEDMGKLPLSNIATKHPELRCFSVVAALLNAKHIDVVGKETSYTPLYMACSKEFKWPIVVHLLDMLKDEPNNRLNDLMRNTTAFQAAVQHSPGAVIALIKQPELKPDMTGQRFEWKTRLDALKNRPDKTQYEMVMAALRHVGATVVGTVEANTSTRTVREYLESNNITTPFRWPI
jgi:hypothetical protein